jgi:hypothetical protein
MSDRQGFINLADCVNHYIDEAELSIHKYYKLWNLAVRAMDELGLDAFYAAKTVRLPVLANKTVTLPADCLQWSKVGRFDGQGQIMTMRHNPKLSSMAALHPDRLTKIEAQDIDLASDTFYNYWDGNTYSNLYGVPSSATNYGSFSVDEAQGVIVLDPDFSESEIVLEYLTSPDYTQDLYLPVQFREAVIAYLGWKDTRYIPSKTHVNNSNVGMRRRDFYNERRLAIARYKPFRADEALDDNRDNTRKTLKG